MINRYTLLALNFLMVFSCSSCTENQTAPSTNMSAQDMPPDVEIDMYEMARDIQPVPEAYQRNCNDVKPNKCEVQTQTTFGDCGIFIGAVFDGTQCVEAYGCRGCQGDSCPLFESVEACSKSCASAGWCQSSKFNLLQPAQCHDLYCEEYMAVCVSSKTDPTPLMAPFGQNQQAAYCRKDSPSRACEFAAILCREKDQWCCTFRRNSTFISPEEYTQVCQLTLQPQVSGIGCSYLND